MRKGRSLGSLVSIVAVLLLAVLGLRVTIPARAAAPVKYVTDVVIPGLVTSDKESLAINHAMQDALDKRSAEGWQLQTITVHFDNYSGLQRPVYVLVFKK